MEESETISQKQKQFDRAEERIAKIQMSLERTNKLTESVAQILDNFDSRFAKLEEIIIPINESMEGLRIAHENMDSTLQSFDKVFSKFEVASDAELRLAKGVGSDLDAYLRDFDRVTDAVRFFQTNSNFRSTEKVLSTLKSAQTRGVKMLEDEFKLLLEKGCSPIDPSKLTDTSADKIELIPIKVVTSMYKISQRLHTQGYLDYLDAYRKARAKTILACITKMIPAGDKSKEEESAKPIKYDKGSHKFLPFMKVFLKLAQAEKRLTAQLVNQLQFDPCFAEIMRPALRQLFEFATSQLKAKKTSERILVLLDLLENLSLARPAFEDVFARVEKNELLQSVLELILTFKSATVKALSEWFTLVVHDGVKISADGTVHEHTSNTLSFLKRLFEYQDVVEPILEVVLEECQGTHAMSLPSTRKGLSNLGKFTVLTALALENNLIGKAKQSTKKSAEALSRVFMLNNHHYIYKVVKGSELTTVVDDIFIEKYQNNVKDDKTEYIKICWSPAVAYLTVDKGQLQAGSDGALPPSAAKEIKKKLSNFNALLEENYVTQSEFSVPDQELKDELRGQIRDTIIRPYQKFIEAVGRVQFTKNPNKYVKFNVDTIENMLQCFFEGRAVAEH